MLLSSVFLLAVPACSSLTHSDSHAPTGIVAASTPWAGVLGSTDLPAGVISLISLSCPSVSTCFGTVAIVGGATGTTGATVIGSDNGGATWHEQAVSPSVGSLSAISCRDNSHCVAVGQTAPSLGLAGAVVTTANGGRSWTLQPAVAGISDITAVTCLANGRCLALGNGAPGAVALVSGTAGAGWQIGGPLPNALGATDVTCADTSHCWATGQIALDADHVAGTVDQTANFGGSWIPVPVPSGTGTLGGISCSAQSGSSASLPFGSSTSSSSTAASPTSAPTATIPGLPNFSCTAVGTTSTVIGAPRSGHGLVLTTSNSGSQWTSPAVPPSIAALSGISCPTGGSCVAVGTSPANVPAAGVVLLGGGTGRVWRKAVTVSVPQAQAAVSCPALGHCVMGGATASEALAPSS